MSLMAAVSPSETSKAHFFTLWKKKHDKYRVKGQALFPQAEFMNTIPAL